ncbi:MAG: YerC/YecD family TrpR-related protein [Parvularculaceae bacterium]
MRGPKRQKTAAARTREGKALFAAISKLKSATEVERFLRDLATPAEIEALAERWRIARLLYAGALSYRDIAAETGASTATVARVARFLGEEGWSGYRLVLERGR